MIATIKTPTTSNIMFKETFDELEKFFNIDNYYRNYNNSIYKTNFSESENNFILEILTPGIKKDEIKISVESQKLKIEIEANEQKNLEKNQYTLKEFEIKSFNKIYSLPKTSDLENIYSKYIDGILYVYIPKKDNKDNKKITISVE
jgi:HSP20 family protein